MQHDRIRLTEIEIDGENVTGHFYTSGPYAITVGQPLYFTGKVQDYERVNAATDCIMEQIRSLALESQNRIQPAQVTEVGIPSALSQLTGTG